MYKGLILFGKVATLGFVVWGVVAISQEISSFHEDGKFTNCKEIPYEKCDDYACKSCEYKNECIEWDRRKKREHCIRYRDFYACDMCLPVNYSKAVSEGYKKECRYCTAIEDKDDRVYELDFECDICNSYSPPYPAPSCVNASLEHCTEGGPLYPFRPIGDKEGYMCLDGYNATDTNRSSVFSDPNAIFDVFDHHGKLLSYSIYGLIALLPFFWAFPIDIYFNIYLYKKLTKKSTKFRNGSFYINIYAWLFLSIIITITAGCLIPLAIMLPVFHIDFTSSKCLFFTYSDYDIFTQTPVATYTLYSLCSIGIVSVILFICGKYHVPFLKEKAIKFLTLAIACVLFLVCTVWSIYIIGKADSGIWWHSTQIQYSIICYSALHALYSFIIFGVAVMIRRKKRFDKEVEYDHNKQTQSE